MSNDRLEALRRIQERTREEGLDAREAARIFDEETGGLTGFDLAEAMADVLLTREGPATCPHRILAAIDRYQSVTVYTATEHADVLGAEDVAFLRGQAVALEALRRYLIRSGEALALEAMTSDQDPN